MSLLLNSLRRFSRWYDSLPGGVRFGYFMAAMALAVFPLRIGLTLELRPLAVFGFAVLCVMTLIAVVRAFALSDGHAKIGGLMLGALVLIALAL